jgi:hypothetical protein
MWRITQPWAEPADENEQEALEKDKALIERLQARTRERSNGFPYSQDAGR